jgi:hypothetical protein
VIKRYQESTTGVCEEVAIGSQIWLMEGDNGVVGDRKVELNSGQLADRWKIVHILVHVRKEQRTNKGIESLLKTHSQ